MCVIRKADSPGVTGPEDLVGCTCRLPSLKRPKRRTEGGRNESRSQVVAAAAMKPGAPGFPSPSLPQVVFYTSDSAASSEQNNPTVDENNGHMPPSMHKNTTLCMRPQERQGLLDSHGGSSRGTWMVSSTCLASYTVNRNLIWGSLCLLGFWSTQHELGVIWEEATLIEKTL